MRVDSHTHGGQAIRVLIHTHISCRLLVEGRAPKPLLNTEFHSVAARSPNAFCPVAGARFRGIGCRESQHPMVLLEGSKVGHPSGRRGGEIPPQFFLPATVATVATVWGVPLKTPSRPLRASRFTRLLQARMLPPPCRSAGYAARRAWLCSHTLPDVLPTGGWHSHSDAW